MEGLMKNVLAVLMTFCAGLAGAQTDQIEDLAPGDDFLAIRISTREASASTLYQSYSSTFTTLGGNAITIATADVSSDSTRASLQCAVYRYVGLTPTSVELIEERASVNISATSASAYLDPIRTRPSDPASLAGRFGELCRALVNPFSTGGFLLGSEAQRITTRLVLPRSGTTYIQHAFNVRPRITTDNVLVLIYQP